ncbi:hypothetical protein OAL01_01795 [Rubripirellula sp.]|nr:hypothetical protein [Rubripirellula sp.]
MIFKTTNATTAKHYTVKLLSSLPESWGHRDGDPKEADIQCRD